MVQLNFASKINLTALFSSDSLIKRITVDGTVLDPCMVLDPFATFYNLARMTGMNARRQKRESKKCSYNPTKVQKSRLTGLSLSIPTSSKFNNKLSCFIKIRN